jgi:hypothetical protein
VVWNWARRGVVVVIRGVVAARREAVVAIVVRGRRVERNILIELGLELEWRVMWVVICRGSVLVRLNWKLRDVESCVVFGGGRLMM